MSYTVTNWVDGETPVNAANLNKLERAMKATSEAVAELQNEMPDESDEVTAESIKTALGYTPANDTKTLRNSGWTANKNLGTDENGNVIEKDDIFAKDTSAWTPVEYMKGVAWKEKGYYWQANGTHTNTQYTQNYQPTAELIRIEPNCSYILSAFSGTYFLYDSTGKNGVASAQYNDPNVAVTFETTENQYYIGINHVPSGSYTVGRVSLVRTTISEAEYNALPTKASTLQPLYGKTVVCFGDSLFGMYRGDDSAPAFVTAETGATVHNVGFGGCRMSVHPTNGYGAFCMWALAKAIAENNWTDQDAQASSGSAYFPEHLALLKSLDFSKVDIAVIHYGTNDFGIGTGVAIGADSPATDYNTICGALRYSVEKLLGKYPKLRIYVSLPAYRYWTADGVNTYSDTYTNAQGDTLRDVAEALRTVAAEYNLPVIDSYYGLGINKANASTFLEDGTHHNAVGRERFGRYIGQNLITQQTSGKSGQSGARATGTRGFSVLRITTAPSSYTTETGGFTPVYRVAIGTVLSQSKATEVMVGDTVLYSYYTYPVGYVDDSYVYIGTRVSIRGATGTAGTTPTKGTDYWTNADKAEMVNEVIAALPVYNGEVV